MFKFFPPLCVTDVYHLSIWIPFVAQREMKLHSISHYVFCYSHCVLWYSSACPLHFLWVLCTLLLDPTILSFSCFLFSARLMHKRSNNILLKKQLIQHNNKPLKIVSGMEPTLLWTQGTRFFNCNHFCEVCIWINRI